MVENDIYFVLKDDLKAYRDLFIKDKRVMTFNRGYIFSRIGEHNDMYFLIEGSVYVDTINDSGYTRFIGLHKENTLFNLDNFKDNKATVHISAASKVRVVVIHSDDLMKLLKTNNDLALDLINYYTKVLRLMCYDAKIQSINSVSQRLIFFIMVYMNNTSSDIIDLSQERIAAAINASRIQVSRCLNQIKHLGIIEIKRGLIKVKDKDKLESLLE